MGKIVKSSFACSDRLYRYSPGALQKLVGQKIPVFAVRGIEETRIGEAEVVGGDEAPVILSTLDQGSEKELEALAQYMTQQGVGLGGKIKDSHFEGGVRIIDEISLESVSLFNRQEDI